jgi:ATP/maltotriose-dependent transcriptional regulator MalT
MLRGSRQLGTGSPVEAYEVLLAGATRAADSDPMQALEMLVRAAEASWISGRSDWAADLGRLAGDVAAGRGDEESFMVALLVGTADLLNGHVEPGATSLRSALARAERFQSVRHLLWACLLAHWLGDVEVGLACARGAVRRLRAADALGDLPFALQQLAAFEFWAGRLVAAGEHATEALALGAETRQGAIHAHVLALVARVEATQGDHESARAHAHQSLEASVARGLVMPAAVASWALGRLELCAGRPEEALSHLRPLVAPGGGFASPVPARLSCPDLVEAAVRCDRPELARISHERFDEWQQRTGSVWGAGVLGRMRALLAGSEDPEPHFQAALAVEGQPLLELARTRLLYGEVLRRGCRRAEAREQLRDALIVLESAGAQPWAERARAELRASGEDVGRHAAGAVLDELTPQEREIATLVAGGAANREIAARLFVSRRTVEHHLQKIYAKLGITSRVTLTRLLADDATQQRLSG